MVALLFWQIESVLLDPLRLLDKKCLELSKTDVPTVEELSHLPTAHDRQIPAKQHPIKTRKDTVNTILIFVDEGLHGFILRLQWPGMGP